MIRAKCVTDDQVFAAEFDATPWFQQASLEELTELKKCGWGGDYASDWVADYMSDKDEGLARLFSYLELKDGKIGFECHIRSDDVYAWLQERSKFLAELFPDAEPSVAMQIRHYDDRHPPIDLTARQESVGVSVSLKGYVPGGVTEGSCLVIEVGDDGHPRILVWSDADDEEPTYDISLAKASRSCTNGE